MTIEVLECRVYENRHRIAALLYGGKPNDFATLSVDDPELEVDLTVPEYGFSSKNQIQLERKEDMKRRGFASPDLGDCWP